jgi:LacI family transcriptional regulator
MVKQNPNNLMKKKTRNITSLDIAKIAGVSRTTVSFVLNNKADKNISEETKNRVLKVVRELGYQPDRKAIDLAKTCRYKIGLLVDISESFHYSDVFLTRLFEAMLKKAKQKRDRLLYVPFNFKTLPIEKALDLDLDAVIIINPKENDIIIQKIKDIKIPLVVLGSISDKEIPTIIVDDFQAAKTATEHMIAAGLKDIAMIAHAPKKYIGSKQRIKGYLAALHENKRPVRNDWIIEAKFNVESGYQAAKELWKLDHKPEGIFAGNDEVAVGAMNFLHENSIVIPDDVSLVGFDDDPLSEYLSPALTTIAVPCLEMGNQCMAQVYSLIKGKKDFKKKIILSSHLVIRETVKSTAI